MMATGMFMWEWGVNNVCRMQREAENKEKVLCWTGNLLTQHVWLILDRKSPSEINCFTVKCQLNHCQWWDLLYLEIVNVSTVQYLLDLDSVRRSRRGRQCHEADELRSKSERRIEQLELSDSVRNMSHEWSEARSRERVASARKSVSVVCPGYFVINGGGSSAAAAAHGGARITHNETMKTFYTLFCDTLLSSNNIVVVCSWSIVHMDTSYIYESSATTGIHVVPVDLPVDTCCITNHGRDL